MEFQPIQPNQEITQNNLDDFEEVWVPNPLGRTQESASTIGLIDILKWDNLDSLLTNPWLVSIFVATVIFVVISALRLWR